MFGAESYGLDDDEPEAWPEVSQQKLDEALRCAICGDLFTMPVR
jgi:E3 ubiquitin-protein ligase RAD18